MKAPAEASIKYTAVLPTKFVSELKELATMKVIPSVNYGIREAIGLYIAECKRDIYAQQMLEAANNKEYMDRTLDTQYEFKHTDSEVGGHW